MKVIKIKRVNSKNMAQQFQLLFGYSQGESGKTQKYEVLSSLRLNTKSLFKIRCSRIEICHSIILICFYIKFNILLYSQKNELVWFQ